jgi:PAS domain-containing protein
MASRLVFAHIGDDRLTVEKLLSPQSLILLVGGAMLFGSALTLGVYLLQRSFSRTLKPDKPRPARVRAADEAAFTLATIRAVVTQLKADQKATQEKLVLAERRAEENARKFEILAREIDYGLMIFDAEGYISFSNPPVRKILAVDTWSRRRYPEILSDLAPLSELLGECFATGTEVRKKRVEFQGSDGSKRRVEVSVSPSRDRTGAMEVVACVFRELAPPTPGA